jgi:hypothetical protein
MTQLRKFPALTAADKILLIQMAAWVVAIKIGLRLLPFGQLRYLLTQLAGQLRRNGQGHPVHLARLVWAATVVGKALLGDRACLTQALAVQFFYQRYGYPTQLRIGVSRDSNGSLTAHAWVGAHDQILIGGEHSPYFYTAFSSLSH